MTFAELDLLAFSQIDFFELRDQISFFAVTMDFAKSLSIFDHEFSFELSIHLYEARLYSDFSILSALIFFIQNF